MKHREIKAADLRAFSFDHLYASQSNSKGFKRLFICKVPLSNDLIYKVTYKVGTDVGEATFSSHELAAFRYNQIIL